MLLRTPLNIPALVYFPVISLVISNTARARCYIYATCETSRAYMKMVVEFERERVVNKAQVIVKYGEPFHLNAVFSLTCGS